MDVLSELEKLRASHFYCDDCWYSCPKAQYGCCDATQGDDCNCGADDHNDRLDKIIQYLKDSNKD